MGVIKGYFPTGFRSSPAPYVQALVRLPRLGSFSLVNLLADTGADNTTLSLIDVERMNLDCRRLSNRSLVPVTGSGGDQLCYQEEAVLFFRDQDAQSYVFTITIHIPKRGRRGEEANRQRELPSIPGRDVINQCSTLIDFQKGAVEFTPPEGAKLPTATRRLI